MATKPCLFSVDGQVRNYTRPLPDRLLYPYRDNVYPSNEARTLLESIRPEVTGNKETRYMKDLVYKELSDMLNRSFINGSYVGLCAAYMPEIFCALYPRIEGEMLNMQYDEKDYLKLKAQLPYIRKAFPSKETDTFLQLRFGDILEYLRTTQKRYAIMDLDMMFELNLKNVGAVVAAVANAAAEESVLALWHGSNRRKGKGDAVVDKEWRPLLRYNLSKEFDILGDSTINYNEGYPMRVDLLRLRRKAA